MVVKCLVQLAGSHGAIQHEFATAPRVGELINVPQGGELFGAYRVLAVKHYAAGAIQGEQHGGITLVVEPLASGAPTADDIADYAAIAARALR